MVIRELLAKAADILKNNGIGDSFNEAAVLLSYALDCSRTYIHTHMDDDADTMLFMDYVDKRKKGMPVAYIVGRAWFMSLELEVNEATLIPRPETEELAEEAIRLIGENPGETINVLDICTGSGCIGLALAHYDERVHAVLCDMNPGCVETAGKNAAGLGLAGRADVLEGDLFEPVAGRKFDVITANPPYIPTDDIPGLMKDVRDYEPPAALDGGKDGLDFYRRIAGEASCYLKKDGFLILEIGIGQSEDTVALLRENGFDRISVKDDIGKIPRIIIAGY